MLSFTDTKPIAGIAALKRNSSFSYSGSLFTHLNVQWTFILFLCHKKRSFMLQ